MRVIPAAFPFSVADGAQVGLSFSDDDLVLRFVEDFVHHVLCFNASKVLEVISRRTPRLSDTGEGRGVAASQEVARNRARS